MLLRVGTELAGGTTLALVPRLACVHEVLSRAAPQLAVALPVPVRYLCLQKSIGRQHYCQKAY